MTSSQLRNSAAAILSIMLFSACGGGSSGGGGASFTATNVSGQAVAGKVNNGVVNVYEIDRSNLSLALITSATTTTDADGLFTLNGLPLGSSYLVHITGGTYVDEATGTSRSLASQSTLTSLNDARPNTLELLLGNGSAGNLTMTATPLTTMLSKRIRDLAAADPTALDESMIAEQARSLGQEMGLGSVDVRYLRPLDFTDTADSAAIQADPNGNGAKYGALLSALSQQAARLNLADPLDLIDAYAEDLRDGVFDGSRPATNPGTVEQIILNGAPIDRDLATGSLASDLNNFLDNNANNQSNFDASGYSAASNQLSELATVDVFPANNVAPSFDRPADLSIPEDSSSFAVTISNVSAGTPAESMTQALTFTVTSSDTSIATVSAVSGTGTSRTFDINPVAEAFGSTTITITVQDDGGTANGGLDTSVKSFILTIDPVNDAPSANNVPALTVIEDSGMSSFQLSNISAGPANESGQSITISMSSSNTSLITLPNPTLSVSGSTAIISYQTQPDANGTAIITLNIRDNGGTANGGSDTLTLPVSVTVTSVNDAPTITGIAPITVLEDSAQRTVSLTGVSAGPSDESTQILSAGVSVTPSGLVTNTSISLSGGNASFSFTPVADAFGTATVTVTISDDGGTANGGVDQVSTMFDIQITSVNDQPTLNMISDVTLDEDSPMQSFDLNGITFGATNEMSQTLTISATSSDTSIVPDPMISAISGGAATLNFTPVADANGSVTITVTLSDDGGTANGGIDQIQRTFAINVTSINDEPVFDSISDESIDEDAGVQTINMTRVGPGPNESAQNLTFTVTSDNTALIPNPTIGAISNGMATLTYTPIADANGTANITVELMDDGGTANSGDDTFSQTFVVTVAAVNDAPTFTAPVDQTIDEDAAQVDVDITAVSAGPANESGQTVTLTATSDNTALVPNPTIGALSNGTATLSFTPVAEAFGTATITIEANDMSGGTQTTSQTFMITVNSVNDAPSFDAISNQGPVNEDSGSISLMIANVSGGPANESQDVTFTFVTSDASILAAPAPVTTSTTTANVILTPVQDAFGTVTITVTASDTDGTANGGVDTSAPSTFTVTIDPVNDAPTFTAPVDQTINEDAAQVDVDITAVSAGPANESGQTVTLTATSDNTALVPNPTIGALSNGTATLSFTPVAEAFGTATITIEANDMSGGTQTTSQTFMITVNSVNDAPSFDAISNQGPVNEDSGSISLMIANVLGGPANESQDVTFTFATSDASILAAPAPVTTSTTTANVILTPVQDAFGTVTITVTASDTDGTANGGVDTSAPSTFTVTIDPVNDAPSIDMIPTPAAVDEDSGAGTVAITGVNPGNSFESGQTVTLNLGVTATPTNLFTAMPTVTLGAGNTATINFELADNLSGSAVFTVTPMDDGGTANGGADTGTPQTFTLTVNPVNDAPSFDDIVDLSVSQTAGTQSVTIANVSSGPGESDTLLFTAMSSDTATINNLVFDSTSNPTSLSYDVLGPTGTATITVTATETGTNPPLSFSDTFVITVLSGAPTNLPTATVPTMAIQLNEDQTGASVTITDINANDAGQMVTALTATPATTTVVASATVNYTPGATTATIDLALVADANGGPTTINLQLTDDGATNNVNSMLSFDVNVNAVNDAPTFDLAAAQAQAVVGASGTMALTNIAAGPVDEMEAVTVTATSSDTGVVNNVTITGTGASQTVNFDAVGAGTSTVTVTVAETGITNPLSTVKTFLVSVTAPAVQAEVVFYDFDNGTSTFTADATRTIAGVTASAITINSGTLTNFGGNPNQSAAGSGFDTSNYFSITLTPTGGNELTLSSIEFDDRASGSGPQSYEVRVISGATDEQVATGSTSGSFGTTPMSNLTVPMTAAGPFTQPVEIRIIGTGASSSGGTWRVDNLKVNGIVAMPMAGGNAAPTVDPVANQTIVRGTGIYSIPLTGLSAGIGDSESFTVSATSSTMNVVEFLSTSVNGSTGSVDFTVSRMTGTTTITVTVDDNQAQPNSVVTTTFDVILTDPVVPIALNEYLEQTFNGTMFLDANNDGNPSNLEDQFIEIINTGATDLDISGYRFVDENGNTTPFDRHVFPANTTLVAGGSIVLFGGGTPTGFPGSGNGSAQVSSSGSLLLTNLSDYSLYDTTGNLIFRFRPASTLNNGSFNRAVEGDDTQDFNRHFLVANANGNFSPGVMVDQAPFTSPSVNPPSADTVAPITINEDAGQQTVTINNINANDMGQTVTGFTVTSSDTGIIPTPTFNFTAGDTSVVLTYTPVADANGTVTMTVDLTDDGASNNTNQFTFTITVNAVNDMPTIDPVTIMPINEDAGQQSFTIRGLSAGGGEVAQTVEYQVLSSDPSVIMDPVPTFTDVTGSATDVVNFTTELNSNTPMTPVTLTINVRDNGGTTNGGSDTTTITTTVTVMPLNDAPSIDTVSDLGVLDGEAVTINLTGIGNGGGADESGQTVIIASVTSSNTSVVPTPTESAISNGSATLTFTVPDLAFGSSDITVTLLDDGGTTNGGSDTHTETFTVRVNNLHGISGGNNGESAGLLKLGANGNALMTAGLGLRGVVAINDLAFFNNASGTSVLYGVDTSRDVLVSINTNNGVATAISTVNAQNINGLAYDTDTNTLYGADDSSNSLVTINTSTGVVQSRGSFGTGFTQMRALAYNPMNQTLYGLEAGNELVTINPVDGSATLIANLDNGVSAEDLVWDTDNAVMVCVDSNTGFLFSINLNDATTTALGATDLRPEGNNAVGLGYETGLGLYVTDGATLTLVDSSNGTLVGTLGRTGFRNVRGAASTPADIYLVDDASRLFKRTSGQSFATFVGIINDGATVTGIESLAWDGTSLVTITTSGRYGSINTTTAAFTEITAVVMNNAAALQCNALAYDGTNLIAHDSNTREIVTVNPVTSAVTVLGSASATDAPLTALEFDSLNLSILGVYTGGRFQGAGNATDNGKLVLIDRMTGALTESDQIGFSDIFALVQDNSSTYAFDENGVQIDLGISFGLGTGGIGNSVGELGLNNPNNLSLDAITGQGYVLDTDATQPKLYSVMLDQGTATFLGTVQTPEADGALVLNSAIDQPGRMLTVINNNLYAVNVNTLSVSLIGATGVSQDVEGLDVDAATGTVYALVGTSSSDTVGTVNTATGAITLLSSSVNGSVTGSIAVNPQANAGVGLVFYATTPSSSIGFVQTFDLTNLTSNPLNGSNVANLNGLAVRRGN